MATWTPWALILGAYLVGSISFARLVAKSYRTDITKEGSGNPGATNVTRTLGRRAGWAVLILDLLKGLGPTLAARWWFGSESPITAGVGLATAMGHVAPIWHRFRGGRGVATGAGALLAVAPLPGAVAVLAFVGVRQTIRLTSVASLVAAATGALVAAGTLGLTSWVTRMGFALFAVVLIRHIPNLRRLRRGEEPPT